MDNDSLARIAAHYDERARQRLEERHKRAMHYRTNPLTGMPHVPLADRVTDAHDDLDAATVSLWKAEQELYRYRRAASEHDQQDLSHSSPSEERAEANDQPYEEAHRLEDVRAQAMLEYNLAANQVERLKELVRLYEAGALPD